MKTLAIILTLFTSMFINTENTAATNTTTTNETTIREQIVKKIGMPELSREKIEPASVAVKFTISDNNLIIVKEISGENSFLNEYVGNKLHHSKIGNTPENEGQEFEIIFNFRK